MQCPRPLIRGARLSLLLSALLALIPATAHMAPDPTPVRVAAHTVQPSPPPTDEAAPIIALWRQPMAT